MNIDWIQWIIRVIIISIATILTIIIWKGKREGKYQEFYLRFYIIGATAFVFGIVLLIVSTFTDLLFDYSLFLTAAGALTIIIGFVVRNTWEKDR